MDKTLIDKDVETQLKLILILFTLGLILSNILPLLKPHPTPSLPDNLVYNASNKTIPFGLSRGFLKSNYTGDFNSSSPCVNSSLVNCTYNSTLLDYSLKYVSQNDSLPITLEIEPKLKGDSKMILIEFSVYNFSYGLMYIYDLDGNCNYLFDGYRYLNCRGITPFWVNCSDDGNSLMREIDFKNVKMELMNVRRVINEGSQ